MKHTYFSPQHIIAAPASDLIGMSSDTNLTLFIRLAKGLASSAADSSNIELDLVKLYQQIVHPVTQFRRRLITVFARISS
ncbi:hypothetical protein J6590_084776 [Homalodisca vitripennis]|nr:hypothetical protein J6590_084776 [Homalodisca vitripennis]